MFSLDEPVLLTSRNVLFFIAVKNTVRRILVTLFYTPFYGGLFAFS